MLNIIIASIYLDGWEWFVSAFIIGTIFFYIKLKDKKK